MKLRIYNPNHRETKCVTCSKSLIQRDSLGALTKVYCYAIKQDLTRSVFSCSLFEAEKDKMALREFLSSAADMDIDPYDGQTSWVKNGIVIRKNGKWKQEMKKRRTLVARRRGVSPIPADPEKVN